MTAEASTRYALNRKAIKHYLVDRDLFQLSDMDMHVCEAFDKLAAIIDRPTCHDVSDFDHEAFKCSLCGHRVLTRSGDTCDAVVISPGGLVSEYRYCPNCGAEAIGDGLPRA